MVVPGGGVKKVSFSDTVQEVSPFTRCSTRGERRRAYISPAPVLVTTGPSAGSRLLRADATIKAGSVTPLCKTLSPMRWMKDHELIHR